MKRLIESLIERTNPEETRASGKKAGLFLRKRIKGSYQDGLKYYQSIYDVQEFTDAFIEGFKEGWEDS